MVVLFLRLGFFLLFGAEAAVGASHALLLLLLLLLEVPCCLCITGV